MSVEQQIHKPNARMTWGSDLIADTLRALGFRYLSMTPGASFRGLHDSIVNHLGDTNPQLLTCIHEESAVALAHGYAKVTGEPMVVAVHSNVGLMHATMAIFNAWCDRVPMVIVGATGPMDAVERRPWVDWIHTGRDLGGLVRGYTKWDDQPASPQAGRESLLRANQIARTAPCGPTYVCLDAHDQERMVEADFGDIDIRRYRPLEQPVPSAAAIAETVEKLRGAKRPLILAGRSTRDRRAWDARIELAERLGARVITDLRSGASFPSGHRLHPHRAGIYIGQDAIVDIGDADVILSLDWIDLAGTLRQAAAESACVIHCSPDQYGHNGWSFDHLGLPPVDLGMLVGADCAVQALNDELTRAGHRAKAQWPDLPTASAPADAGPDSPMSIYRFARTTADALRAADPCYIRLPIGWPGDCCDFDDPCDYLGYDGGGGIGSGPGMAVGAALALKDSGRLPVAILGDGDFLMGATAIWTAVRYQIPLLIIVANNASFFNDEIHQERMAIARGRPVENRSIGISLGNPVCDIAAMARAQGAHGIGPVDAASDLSDAIGTAIEHVRGGGVCVIDARVVSAYGRQVLRGLLQPSSPERSFDRAQK